MEKYEWRTKSGDKVSIPKMNDQHLVNTIKWMHRNNRTRGSRFALMLHTAQVRGLVGVKMTTGLTGEEPALIICFDDGSELVKETSDDK